jgi:hypothetical protein
MVMMYIYSNITKYIYTYSPPIIITIIMRYGFRSDVTTFSVSISGHMFPYFSKAGLRLAEPGYDRAKYHYAIRSGT